MQRPNSEASADHPPSMRDEPQKKGCRLRDEGQPK
jgi:hypothetical protein